MTGSPTSGSAGAPAGDALDAVLPRLRCPVCSAELARTEQAVRCPNGHSFDIARQGYLNLAVGRRAGTADTAAMVAARAEFLGRGHYSPIAAAVSHLVQTGSQARPEDLIIDLAGGTGYHLGVALAACDRAGACLDLSVPALRRAARAHPKLAAIGADAWQPLPFADAVAGAVLSIFGPRSPGEIERVLAPGAVLVTVTPEPDHLAQLAEPLGMIGIDPDKRRRAAAAFVRFGLSDERRLNYVAGLTRDDAYAAAAMGPSAWHIGDTVLRARADRLPHLIDVDVAVTVRAYRPLADLAR